jgi:hypothetical protein
MYDTEEQAIRVLTGYRHKGKPVKLDSSAAYATVSNCTVILYPDKIIVQGEVRVRVGGKKGVVQKGFVQIAIARFTFSSAIRAMAMELVAQQNISLPADDCADDYDEDYDEDYEDDYEN